MSAPFHPDSMLTSWGRVVRERHHVARPRFGDELGEMAQALSAEKPGLAIGLRRSYGDSNLNPVWLDQ